MSDPLIEWTLERDVLRSDVRPHRLKSPDDSAVWLEAHEADQFERAKAITAAWAERGDEAQRFTAASGGCAVDLIDAERPNWNWIVNFQDTAQRDAFRRQLHRPAPPADDLPEGVSWVLIADGSVVRGLPDDEWERRLGTGWVTDRNAIASPGITYIVRRRPTPPPPAVERVPWWEAMTQELPIAEWGGQRIKHAKLQNSGMFLSTWGLYNVIRVDAADGTVEVLRQDGAA